MSNRFLHELPGTVSFAALALSISSHFTAVPMSAVQGRASGSADARAIRSQRADPLNEHRLGERLELVEGGDRPLWEALGLAKR